MFLEMFPQVLDAASLELVEPSFHLREVFLPQGYGRVCEHAIGVIHGLDDGFS